MTVIKKHILIEFLKVLLFTFTAFCSLFVLIDFIEKVDDFMDNKASAGVMFMYFLYKTPFIFSQVIPISVLMATLISLNILNKNNEITALKSSGTNLIDAFSPLFVAGLAISVFVFFLNEVVTPSAKRLSSEIEQSWLKSTSKSKQLGTFTKEGYWIKTENSIIKIKSFENNNEILHGVTIYKINDKLSGSISIPTIKWTGKSWIQVTKTPVASAQSILQYLPEPSKLGTSTKKTYRDMYFTELYEYIEELEAHGHQTSLYKVELYSKVAFPLVSFIMVLIGIPFGLKSGRQGSVSMGIALSFLIAFSYWIIFGITISLGTRGIVPPIIGAFFTDILFFAIGVLMLGYVKR